MLTYDLAIAGGGPAGLALAARVADRGLSVVVLEAAPAPPDKACGEGLMPAGVRALEALGVVLPEGESARFAGIRYVQEGSAVEARFGDGSGLGVRRTVLVGALEERARAAGAEVRHGCSLLHWSVHSEVELETSAGPLRARVLAGADGLASPIRVASGLDRPVRGPGRFGVRRHYEIAPWTDMVEVHWEAGVEAYVTPVGPRLVGVAFLFTAKAGGFDELLARFPALEERLRGAPHASETRGAGPLERAAVRRSREGVVLVGDAAGYVDAITGEGLTLAFLAGEVLADELARGRRRSFPDYERAFRRLFFRYEWFTRGLLLFSRHPRLRRRALSLLARWPRVFEALLRVAVAQLHGQA